MANKPPTTRPRHRDAKDGRFILKESFGRSKPKNNIKERIPLPSDGATK